MTDKQWLEYKARRCEVLARLARRRGNAALMALWKLCAQQYRDQIREAA